MTIIDTTDMGAGGPLNLTIPSFKATTALIRQLGDVLRSHSGTTDVNIKLVGNLSMEILRVGPQRSEEHTSELQSRGHLVCRLLLEKKKKRKVQQLCNKERNKHSK